ncbi:asialoglycoprotein receptor 1-like [Colossoma macropomum]|uniref:asialoglycoprotein receptor 1-like n=1 Tax=Colossoma macropomum TaxID=42526 RepID=UPI001864C849|nr:asialoglycoprotein receptor 1-like [Colossoma macropomum]
MCPLTQQPLLQIGELKRFPFLSHEQQQASSRYKTGQVSFTPHFQNMMENHYSSMDVDEEHRGSPKAFNHRKLSFILLVSGALVIFILFVMIFVVYGYQERRFAELERSMISHHSSVNSMNSDLKGKLKDTGTELETMVSELKKSVSGLSSYVDLYTSRMHDQLNTGPQVNKLSEIQILMNKLNSSLGSLSSKMETKLQDAATQQNGQHTELKRFLDHLNSSVSELTAKLQDTDQKVMAAFSEMKDKLESSSKTAGLVQESQNRTLIEVVKLSSSVESLSSKLQSTDQRVMDALNEMKAKPENSSKPAVTSCKPGWTQRLSRCYWFSNDTRNWHQAREYCRTQNASILKVENEDEWAFVTANLNEYWIGLTDEITGQWRWADETPYVIDRKKWAPGQPDNWTGDGEDGEHCAHIRRRKLNDLHCKIRMNYICKA